QHLNNKEYPMEKVFAMNAAALLAQAACSNVGGNLTISPDLSDNSVRAKNLHVWEVFRVFYHAIVKAMSDSSWPAPTIDGSNLLPILPNSPPAETPRSGLLKNLLAAIPQLPAAPPGPVPDPGANPAPAPAR